MDYVAFLIIVFLVVLGLCAVIWQFVIRPWLLVTFALTALLAISCSHAATFEVSVIVENDADRTAANDAITYAAQLYRSQLGLDLVATVVDVNTVAGHTHAQALLDALEEYRVSHDAHRATDATVLFTRRTLTMGATEYAGLATTGPACSAAASALVELRGDGFDGQILAHELLHTLGIVHDAAPGYLMSKNFSRVGSDTINPDDVLTVKATPLDCMVSALTPQAVPSSVGSPSNSGGGGALDWISACILGALALLAIFSKLKNDTLRTQAAEDHAHILELIEKLRHSAPADFAMLDVSDAWARPSGSGERLLLVKFATESGMVTFHNWLRAHRRRIRTEYETRANETKSAAESAASHERGA
jgi:hypothetical protein